MTRKEQAHSGQEERLALEDVGDRKFLSPGCCAALSPLEEAGGLVQEAAPLPGTVCPRLGLPVLSPGAALTGHSLYFG